MYYMYFVRGIETKKRLYKLRKTIRLPPAIALPFAVPPVLLPENVAA